MTTAEPTHKLKSWIAALCIYNDSNHAYAVSNDKKNQDPHY